MKYLVEISGEDGRTITSSVDADSYVWEPGTVCIDFLKDGVKVASFSQEPSELLVEEISDILVRCQIVWAYEVAQRIRDGGKDLDEATVMARLFSFVAEEHAAAHNIPNPQIVPIPTKRNGRGMGILSAKKKVLQFQQFHSISQEVR